MSSYKVTISGKSGDIVLSECVELISCKVDTPDDSNARSTVVANSMVIAGRIDIELDPIKQLYEWSLTNANREDCYRKVTAEFLTKNGRLLRSVTFPNAFVVDYNENFSQAGGTFNLFIKQKKDNNENIAVDGH